MASSSLGLIEGGRPPSFPLIRALSAIISEVHVFFWTASRVGPSDPERGPFTELLFRPLIAGPYYSPRPTTSLLPDT